jgi:hypothetical protein
MKNEKIGHINSKEADLSFFVSKIGLAVRQMF